MIEKDLKKLNRNDLVEIIYQYQQQAEDWEKERTQLQSELADRRIKVENAGSVAEAALALNDVFTTAQKAADQYLEEIKAAHAETEIQIAKMKADAQAESDALIAAADKYYADMKKRGEDEYAEKIEQATVKCAEMRQQIANMLESAEILHLFLAQKP